MQPASVTMLVANPCVADARVIKEAETLQRLGWRVRVLCLQADGAPDLEERNGVTYERLHWPRRFSSLPDFVDLVARGRAASNPLWYGVVPVVRLVKVAQAVRTALTRLAAWRRILRPFRSTAHGTAPRKKAGAGLATTLRRKLAFYAQYDIAELAFRDRLVELRPDVVHAHDLMTLPVAIKAARQCGAKVAFDAHELEQERNPPLPKRAKDWIDRIERRYIPAADAVIVVSHGAARYMRDHHPGIAEPVVIHNAPDTDAPRTTTRRLREEMAVPQGAILAAYVGGVGINRGVDQLVHALILDPRLHLAIVGPRNDRFDEPVRDLARTLEVASRVVFLDPVPPDQVIHFVADADIGIYALQNVCLNHDLAMPNKLFEMRLAGLPLAVGRTRDIRQFVEETGAGLIMDETDPADIARVASNVFARSQEFRPTGERLSALREQYGWRAQEKKLARLYEAI